VQVLEPLLVEAFVPEFAAEALDVAGDDFKGMDS
jgi:hypothetical protein